MSFFPMAGTALKNLFSKPATRLYPYVRRETFEGTRGDINIEFEKCILCGMCARRCPTSAIAVNREKKEWKIDHLSCVACGNCVTVCPKKCLTMGKERTPTVLAADRLDRTETHAAGTQTNA